MKKFLVILMVVAVSSFLFVGCLPGTTTPPTTPPPTTPVTPTTVAPVITGIDGITLTGSSEYINAAEADDVIVAGTAPTYSEVRVYVDGITAGTGNTGNDGVFTVVIAEADLGADGAKTLYATAKETGLDESAHSVEYTFTLDQDAPGIDSVAATAFDAGTAEAATPAASPLIGGTTAIAASAFVAGDVETGTWLITVAGLTATQNNVAVTHLGVTELYTMVNDQVIPADLIIPGVTFTMEAGFTVGHATLMTCIALVADVVDRYTLKFDEDVDFAGSAAGAYEIFESGISICTADPAVYKTSNDTGYWDTQSGGIIIGELVTFTVSGVTDLAGNPGGTVAVPLTKTCNAGIASATSLEP